MKINTLLIAMLALVFLMAGVAFIYPSISSKLEHTKEARADTETQIIEPNFNSSLTDTSMSNYKIKKTENEWKEELTPEEYRVLRQKGTERAFTGEYYENHKKGVYTCAACQEKLFDSDTKYESGSGWPSFYTAIEGKVDEITDRSHGMVRTEVVCSNCGSHLGHVFNDGPRPTGMRYCINSVSLDFEEEK